MNSYYEKIYARKNVSSNLNFRSLIGNIPGCFIGCFIMYYLDFSLERGFDNSHQTIVPIAIVVLKKQGLNKTWDLCLRCKVFSLFIFKIFFFFSFNIKNFFNLKMSGEE